MHISSCQGGVIHGSAKPLVNVTGATLGKPYMRTSCRLQAAVEDATHYRISMGSLSTSCSVRDASLRKWICVDVLITHLRLR